MTFAVVGHVEWAEFARVARVPAPGEIVHAAETWQQAAGGGAVAAVQISRLTGRCRLFTALADDELGHRAARELEAAGLDVAVAWRPEPQRRAFVFLDDDGERTITTIGTRAIPTASDPLPWDELADSEAVYVTAGDAGALQAARRAGRLVATVRTGPVLAAAGVQLDALVRSTGDAGEAYRAGDIDPPPVAVVSTRGSGGGTVEHSGGRRSEWKPAPAPGPRLDVYGAGDSFAAGLTVGLGQGLGIEQAVALAARCGAEAVARRGPYGRAPDRG